MPPVCPHVHQRRSPRAAGRPPSVAERFESREALPDCFWHSMPPRPSAAADTSWEDMDTPLPHSENAEAAWPDHWLFAMPGDGSGYSGSSSAHTFSSPCHPDSVSCNELYDDFNLGSYSDSDRTSSPSSSASSDGGVGDDSRDDICGRSSYPTHLQHAALHQPGGAAAIAAEVRGPHVPCTTAPPKVAGCCPFCFERWDCATLPPQRPQTLEGQDGARTTRRRREMKGTRRQNRKSKWWSRVGYSGPAYCQRCSEIFRDHIIRTVSNSANCSRHNPCDDCAKILAYFPDKEEAYRKMDAKHNGDGSGSIGSTSVDRSSMLSSSDSVSSNEPYDFDLGGCLDTDAGQPNWVLCMTVGRGDTPEPEPGKTPVAELTAPPEPAVPPQPTVAGLQGMSLRALVARAESAGVDDKGKAALIELIMTQTTGIDDRSNNSSSVIRGDRTSSPSSSASSDGGVGDDSRDDICGRSSYPTHLQHAALHQPGGAAAIAAEVRGPHVPCTTAPPKVAGCCPFCFERWDCATLPPQRPQTLEGQDGARTTRRRREMKGTRRQNRKSKWWSRVGYSGPAYCQRCSEIFRDHIIRTVSNSANCSRHNPCDDCAKILAYFPDKEEAYRKMDAKHRKRPVEPNPDANKRARLVVATAVASVVMLSAILKSGATTSDANAQDWAATSSAGCRILPRLVGNTLRESRHQAQYSECVPGTVCKFTCAAGHEPVGDPVFCTADGSIDGLAECRSCTAPRTTSPFGVGCARCTECAPGEQTIYACTPVADTVCGSWDDVTVPGLEMVSRHSAAAWTDARSVGWIFGGLGPGPDLRARQANDQAIRRAFLQCSFESVAQGQTMQYCEGTCQPESVCREIAPYMDSAGFRSDMWKLLRNPSEGTVRIVPHERKRGAAWPAYRSHAASWANDETGHGFVFGGQRHLASSSPDVVGDLSIGRYVVMSDLWTFNGDTWTLLGGSAGSFDSIDGFIDEISFEKAAFEYKYQRYQYQRQGTNEQSTDPNGFAEAPPWCAPLALAPLPLIFSYKYETSLCGTGLLLGFLVLPPRSGAQIQLSFSVDCLLSIFRGWPRARAQGLPRPRVATPV